MGEHEDEEPDAGDEERRDDPASIEGCRRIADLAQFADPPKLDDDKAGRDAGQTGLGQARIELGDDATHEWAEIQDNDGSVHRDRRASRIRAADEERVDGRHRVVARVPDERTVQRDPDPAVEHRPDLAGGSGDVQPEHLRHQGIAQDRRLVRDVEDGAGGLLGKERLDGRSFQAPAHGGGECGFVEDRSRRPDGQVGEHDKWQEGDGEHRREEGSDHGPSVGPTPHLGRRTPDFGRVLVETCARAYDARTTRSAAPITGCVRRVLKETIRMIEQQPTVVEPTPVVSLTDAAASKLHELTKDETNPDIGLRVYVYSGGCSGYRYGMMLEDAPTPEDNRLDVNGVKVYLDGQSVALLQGSQIDYVDTLMGAGFTVNNPNAVAACGCGSSFRTADDAGTARSCAH
jgi:iron-sulfur cluster assembly accessory protein